MNFNDYLAKQAAAGVDIFKLDLFPFLEQRAAEFGVKLKRLDGQVYGITQLPATNVITGFPYAVDVAFMHDEILGHDIVRMEWLLDVPPYYDSQRFMTAYCQQWGYPPTPACAPGPVPYLPNVGGYKPEWQKFAHDVWEKKAAAVGLK